ncbi:MAG: hypothetical protein ABWZ15_01990 [Acidimicrobiia bacterium]
MDARRVTYGSRSKASIVIEIVIFAAFFLGLVVGALVAEARGSLPSAERLQEEDLERMAQWYRTR